MRIAIPLADGKLCMHFGHCEQFALLDVDRTSAITELSAVSGVFDEPVAKLQQLIAGFADAINHANRIKLLVQPFGIFQIDVVNLQALSGRLAFFQDIKPFPHRYLPR